MSGRFVVADFALDVRRGSPLLWQISIMMGFGFVVCLGVQFFDARLIAGVSVWEKPAKFFLSLSVQSLTLSWALSLIPERLRGITTATWLFVAALSVEMAYMVFRASRAEASHFNQSTVFATVMYGLMGVGSLCLTGASAFVGWRVWQNRRGELMREAAGLGLMLGSLLATLAGGYLASRHNHWIGGDQTDATGLGFFHWSTTGGDLRVSHFIGLHTAQFLPLSALSGSRIVVYAVAAASIALTGLTFLMALNGIPLLRS